jgi:DNA mismatch endonuclease (patch repair protein)
MARVRGRDTGPEMAIRRALRTRGVGYRVQARDLPGSPDLVMRGRGLAVFVHGCFWHRHAGCRLCTTPRSNAEFWEGKFDRNVARDARDLGLLLEAGWRVAVVWECETRTAAGVDAAVARICGMAEGGRRIRRRPDGRPKRSSARAASRPRLEPPSAPA